MLHVHERFQRLQKDSRKRQDSILLRISRNVPKVQGLPRRTVAAKHKIANQAMTCSRLNSPPPDSQGLPSEFGTWLFPGVRRDNVGPHVPSDTQESGLIHYRAASIFGAKGKRTHLRRAVGDDLRPQLA